MDAPKCKNVEHFHLASYALLDQRLLEEALAQRRKRPAPDEFAKFNLAVALVTATVDKVVVDEKLIHAWNTSSKMHSEQHIAGDVQAMAQLKTSWKYEVKQVYSERMPCFDCMSLIDNLRKTAGTLVTWTNVKVYYSVKDAHEAFGGGKAEAIMGCYGIHA
jgi:hypothetical protein